MTKIAVIGSAEFIEKAQSVANKMANIELDMYIYQQPQESSNLLKQLKPCDVVFFSGALPYYFSKTERERLPIPSLYLAQDDMTVAASFLDILYHKGISLQRISVDLIDSSIVSIVLEAANINVVPNHVIDYKTMLDKNELDISQLVSFHQSRWEQGKIDLALTSVHAVYDQLVQLKIPSMRMADPPNALIKGLKEAKAQAEYMKSQSAQVAIVYISLNELFTEQHKLIDSLANSMHSSVQQLEDSLFTIFSTRGDIQLFIENGFLHEIFTTWPNHLAIGFGYGATIKEADENARIALCFAEKEPERSCSYILTDKKELHNPVLQEHKHQRLINDRPEFFEIAQKTKLSPANLSKIIQFGVSRHLHHFTTADLADYLQITRRSAERIIKKLADNGYVQVVGEEMTYQQGRPRALYILKLPIYY